MRPTSLEIRTAASQLDRLEALIIDKKPEFKNELTRVDADFGPLLAESLNAQQCWDRMWDKPIWANNRTNAAEIKVKSVGPLLGNAFEEIADENGRFRIERRGRGISKRHFLVTGELARVICETHRLAPQRFYAIERAARWLKSKSAKNATPMADLVDLPVIEVVDQMRDEIGFKWGNITILHFLTDLGLACKPDIHVVRTLYHLGLLDFTGRIPNLRECDKIIRIAKQLAEIRYGHCRADALRKTDLVLMRASHDKCL